MPKQRVFSGKDARIQQQRSSECKQIAELGTCKSTSVMIRLLLCLTLLILVLLSLRLVLLLLRLLIFLLLRLLLLFLLLLLLGFARGAVSGRASSMIPALQACGSFPKLGSAFAAPGNVMRGIPRSNPLRQTHIKSRNPYLCPWGTVDLDVKVSLG